MSAIVWTDVTDLAPALATGVSSNAQAAILVLANGLAECAFQTSQYFLARVYYAAHVATMVKRAASGGGGAVGAVTSQSAGGLARSYGSVSDTRLLATTTFGSLFLTLLDQAPARCPFVP